MILALNDDSTKKQIKEARDAYEALDETHKAIFNNPGFSHGTKCHSPNELHKGSGKLH